MTLNNNNLNNNLKNNLNSIPKDLKYLILSFTTLEGDDTAFGKLKKREDKCWDALKLTISKQVDYTDKMNKTRDNIAYYERKAEMVAKDLLFHRERLLKYDKFRYKQKLKEGVTSERWDKLYIKKLEYQEIENNLVKYRHFKS